MELIAIFPQYGIRYELLSVFDCHSHASPEPLGARFAAAILPQWRLNIFMNAIVTKKCYSIRNFLSFSLVAMTYQP